MTNSSTTTLSDYAFQLRRLIRDFSPGDGMRGGIETQFNGLALSLFKLQLENNASYRRFCVSRNVTPATVQNWMNIPAVPAAAFKELELTSIADGQRTAVFHSSGTTEQRPSRHFHCADSLELYEASLLQWFAAHFRKTCCIFLTPPPSLAPHSSLAHMFETIRRGFASPESLFTGELLREGGWDIDLQKAEFALRKAISLNRPVNVLGTAFNFVHLTDYMVHNKFRLDLPRGSSVLETGGYKGRSRALPKNELHNLIAARLGVPSSSIVSEYGMSELSSQAYDCAANGSGAGERVFRFPPWARAQIISPETGREVNNGETGLIRIFDLANVYSVMAIQTEDLGVKCDNGFELIGRAMMAEPRGCSLASI